MKLINLMPPKNFNKIVGLALILFLTIGTSLFAQQQKVQLTGDNQTLKTYFNQIEEQAKLFIDYNTKDIDDSRRISKAPQGKNVKDAMEYLLKGTDCAFKFQNNHIIITKQQKNISKNTSVIGGTVIDEGGEPLVGVSIVTKESKTGTTTDLDGKFSIDVGTNTSLLISYIGFVSQEIPLTGKTSYKIILKEDQNVLEETVVVGYGMQKKASVVGSVQSLKVAELKVPSPSLTTGFAGRLAGVIAVQRSGEPGADGADFWIRGISTFSGAVSPLIIIDGVKASSGDLNALDPEVIESFSILKDATATALYGTRGANGVMIVTTKTGRDLDKPVVNARLETSYTSPIKVPKFVDGTTYMKMFNEAVTSRGTGEILYTEDKIDGTSRGVDPFVFPDVDWYNELFKKGSMNQNFNINIRGGGKRMDYFSSISVNHEDGMLRSSKNFSYNNNLNITRYVLQNNINVNITPSTKASVKINAQLRDYHGPHSSAKDIFDLVMKANPVDFPIRFPDDPEYNYIKWGGKTGGAYNNGQRNPYAEMVKGYSDNFQSMVLGTMELQQGFDFITKGLSANALFSFKNWSETNTSRSGDYNQFEVADYTWNANRTAIDNYSLRRVGKEEKTTLETSNSSGGDRQIYLQAMINYDRTFNNVHNVTAMALYNQEEFSVNNPDGLIKSLPKRKQGIAGRLTYAYDFKYLLEANFGYNGSENFAKGHRFGFFPSIGGGYVVSRENYFEPLSKVITNFKIRGSWGLVGNDHISDERFLYLSDLELESADLSYTTGRDQTVEKWGPKYKRFANPNISWEVGEKINLGVDISILNNLNLALDVFKETRRDIFLERKSVPEFVGISPKDKWMNMTTKTYGNLGKVKNTGFDFSVDFNKQFSRDFYASIKGTFTYAKNEVLAEDEPSYAKYPNLSRVGHPIDRQLLYIADRLYIDEAEVKNSPTQNIGGFVGAGDIKYVNLPDANGERDKVIDANDRRYTGYPTVPEIVYGFGASFQYKKFDFSFFFQGVARTSIVMKDFHPFGTDEIKSVLQFIANDYWSENVNPNIYAEYPRLSKLNNTNNTVASTYWQRDGAFLKLKNAEIGFNHKFMRIYVRGSNLLTFSKFKHWDPEQGGGNGLVYPTQRVFNLGIQFSFNK